MQYKYLPYNTPRLRQARSPGAQPPKNSKIISKFPKEKNNEQGDTKWQKLVNIRRNMFSLQMLGKHLRIQT